MNARSLLTLLVVLVLGAAVFGGTAGSAMHPQERGVPAVAVDDVAYLPSMGGHDSGDDDRWGDTESWDGDGSPSKGNDEGGEGADEGDGQFGDEGRPVLNTVRVELRFLFGLVLVLLNVQ